MTALMRSCCCIHAAKTWTPTNDREGVTRTRGPCGSAFFLTGHSARPPFPAIEPPCFPQPGLVSFRDLSSRTPVWTWGVTWVALGYRHVSILLKDQDALFPSSLQCLFFILMKSEH